MTSLRSRRAAPIFGVMLVVVGIVAAVSPVIPSARALDPTPAPSGEETPAPAPTPDPTPEPTPDPTPAPTADPTSEPTAAPADPTPDPGADAPADPAPADPAPADPAESSDPAASPDPSGSPDPGASPVPDESPSASPEPTPVPGGLKVTHTWVDTVNAKGAVVDKGSIDAAATDAERFTVYRIRFQVLNDGETTITLRPELQVEHAGGWTSVPEVDPQLGVPFYAAADDGKRYRKRDAAIDAADLRLAESLDPAATAVDGRTIAGRNPAPPLRLPAHSFSELEFAVRATIDASWETAYDFRVVDGKDVIAEAADATIRLRAKPKVRLSPGQREGEDVAATRPRYALDLSGIDQPANTATITGSLVGLRMPLAAGGPFTSPHMDYTLSTDACAACHSTHRAQAPNLLGPPAPVANVCFSCHDGTGATADVQAEFNDPAVPDNDRDTATWYSHPALATTTHVSDREDEFGGVLNRHAACADCHQPHNSDATRPVATADGWTAAGTIKGAAGVSVVNGAAGSAPAYTLETTTEFEYQLCFKCHSGYTELSAQDPAHPSRWALDKAIELNPANVSYHPIEAPGKNQTNAMNLSLDGSSPYKLWNFDADSTIRCLNCHGDSALANPAAPPDPDAVLDNHAGPNRGLLIAPYRDRDLLAANELYDAEDSALCLVCHGEEPNVDNSGDIRFDTNFNWHGFHLNNLMFKGTGGLDIDVDGDGQGNATCAECHFRTHSTEFAVEGQAPAKGLVNFSPNIEPLNGEVEFVPATSTTLGTCTLTCHGKPHDNYVYLGAP